MFQIIGARKGNSPCARELLPVKRRTAQNNDKRRFQMQVATDEMSWVGGHNINWTESRLMQEIAKYEARIELLRPGAGPDTELTRTYLQNVLERRRKMLTALRGSERVRSRA
jgi:hypothetical protein